MSIISEVRKQREEHTEAAGVLMHPMDAARATVEAWEQEEANGHYGIPSKLTHIAGLEVLRDDLTEEGKMRVVSAEEYESIVSERLERWKQEARLK